MTDDNCDISVLSPREKEIAKAYADGASYREIADRLCIAPTTVRTHLQTIYRKLGVTSKIALLHALMLNEEDNGPSPAAHPANSELGSAITSNTTAGRTITSGAHGPRVGSRKFVIIVACLLALVVPAIWLHSWTREQVSTASNQAHVPLPEKPSIVVLPFRTNSKDKKIVTFADALNANITSGLSRFRGLFVIARNSALRYKDKPAPPKQVSEALGARYILQADVEPREQDVRVTTQLVDAISGENIWINQFDRKLDEVFVVQDDITKSVVTALPGRIKWTERKRLRHTGTEFLNAYEILAKAEELLFGFTPKGNKAGLKLAESAIQSDPYFARAYAMVSWAHFFDWQWYGVDKPQESLRLADEFARKAINIDPSEPEGYNALGYVLLYQGQHEASLAMLQKGLEANPNYADLIAGMADPLLFSGRPKEAVQWINRAMRLNPFHPNWYYFQKGIAHYVAKEYEEVIATIKQASPVGEARRLMAASYAYLGDMENAKIEAEKFLKDNPTFSVKYWVTTQPFLHEEDRRHAVKGLLLAGLPE